MTKEKSTERRWRERFVARYKAHGEHELLLQKLAEYGEWRMDTSKRGRDTEYTFAFWDPIDPEEHVGCGRTMRRAIMLALRSWVREVAREGQRMNDHDPGDEDDGEHRSRIVQRTPPRHRPSRIVTVKEWSEDSLRMGSIDEHARAAYTKWIDEMIRHLEAEGWRVVSSSAGSKDCSTDDEASWPTHEYTAGRTERRLWRPGHPKDSRAITDALEEDEP